MRGSRCWFPPPYFMPAAHDGAAADDDHDSATAFPASVFALTALQTASHAGPKAASSCSVPFLVFQVGAMHAGLCTPSGFHRG